MNKQSEPKFPEHLWINPLTIKPLNVFIFRYDDPITMYSKQYSFNVKNEKSKGNVF